MTLKRVVVTGIGALTPKPIKLKNDSVKIALGTCKVALTIMTDKQLGMMCFLIVIDVGVPIDLLAKTYSVCLIDKT